MGIVELQPAAVLLTGAVGVGKTTVAESIGHRLRAQSTPHAVIDLDALRRAWPPPADDPFHFALEIANLRAVSGNCRAAGARRLVLAGVLEREVDRAAYEEALAVPMRVVRLDASAETAQMRLRGRHAPGTELAWHLARAAELARILSENGIGDVVVDTDDETPDRIAARVLEAIGW